LLLLQTDGPVKKPAFNFNSINKRSPAARLNLSRHKARVPSSRRSAQPAFSASSCANELLLFSSAYAYRRNARPQRPQPPAATATASHARACAFFSHCLALFHTRIVHITHAHNH